MLQLLRTVKHAIELHMDRRRYTPLYTQLHEDVDAHRHIEEAAQWLERAQDGTADRGFAYGCRLGEPYLASYPETTGYIIPTFLELGRRTGDGDYVTRAIEAGQWEIDVQMDCGAVMGGRVDVPTPTPAVFNTGQVLLGWAALHEQTGEQRFLDAGSRAAAWMASLQRDDGSWLAGNSDFASARNTVYNVRAGWGLARMGVVAGEKKWIDGGVRSGEYALSRRRPNGWFAECCLDDPERPLLHTLAYTMRGLLELGGIAGRQDFVDAARGSIDGVTASLDRGFLPGRFHEDLSGAAHWCCLTGSAQTSIICSKLHRLTGEASYRETALALNDYLMRRHDVTSKDDRIRGGVLGSWPAHGDYGRFLILNWATKFLLDALLEADAR